jgi:arabinofuranan 3-O-arabinosyltransferase
VVSPTPSVSVQRLRLAAVCLVITLLVFTQSSGLEAADTKLDLVVAPWHFLVQSVSAWDPTAAGGGLGNQAYGYLFPMGPFFLVGHLMQLPPWVIQRSWESALLVAAFLGVFRLSRLLGVAGWWPRVAAGLTYALAPRMLMEIGVISAELLPVVVAPWVLIPLVRGSRGGSPRRAAALSGVALLFAGGTNAAATLAILPIPILWLLTRERGKRRASLMRWWALAVGLSCLWWTVPLIVLGRYSPPFLNWIESASVTTIQTSLANSLRGVEHWEAYLGSGVWPSGFIFVTQRTVIFASAVVAAAGLIGVALRRTPHRLFLGSCVATGLVLITFGHPGAAGPLLSATERTALDGPLDAFRNVHKFDPVLRLPIALGVGQVVAAGFARWGRRDPTKQPHSRYAVDPRVTGVIAALCIAIGAIAPAVTGILIPAVRGINEPSWWSQTATWLGQQGDGRALVVPGAAQPVYVWGSPIDDALQPVATSPWSVRDSIPLAQAGYIRLLTQLETRMAEGRGDPTLAAVLARSGIRYVVVRNDLDTTASDTTPLQFVYATLDNSAGLRAVHTFGPNVTSVPDPNRLVDSGATATRPAITVYENTAWRDDVSLLPVSQAVTANGSADNLPELTAAGVTPDQPVIFGPSTLPRSAGSVPVMTALTDGVRKREFSFGGTNRYSDTMTASQPYEVKRAAHDYLPSPAPPLSTVSYQGIEDVTASTSGADADAVVNLGPGNGPWSAVDGNPLTAWRIGAFHGAVGQWLQVDTPAAINVSHATVSFVGIGQGFPSQIRVDTAAGHVDEGVVPDGSPQLIRLPVGETQFVRITILGTADGGLGLADGIAQLSIPSVFATRTLDVPGTGSPDVITFAVADGHRNPCLTVAGSPACEANWAASGEEDGNLDRSFSLSANTAYDTRAMVTLAPGQALDQLLDRGNPFHVVASSVDSFDPRERPGAAVDGNTSTGWMASASDLQPTIIVATPHKHRITGIELTPLAPTAPARAPIEIRLTAGSESIDRVLPASGSIFLPRSVRTRSVSVHVIRAALRLSTNSTTGTQEFLPVGIAELDLLGPHEPRPTTLPDVTVTCTDGVAMTVDGQRIPLRLKVRQSAVLAGDTVPAKPCPTATSRSLHQPASWLTLGSGPHRITLNASSLTEPQSLLLRKVDQPSLPTPIALPVSKRTWSPTSRSVRVQTSVAALLVVHENVNQGWRATLAGAALAPVTVDGWQQAWVVPAGANGIVVLRFTPQAAFAAGLIAGAGAAVLLVLLTLPVPRRRPRRVIHPAVRTASPGTLIRWTAVVATLTLLGSLSGLAIAAGLIVIEVAAPALLRTRVTAWALAITAAATIAAETAATAASHHPLADSTGVQLLCLVTIGVVLSRCLATRDGPPGAGEPSK